MHRAVGISMVWQSMLAFGYSHLREDNRYPPILEGHVYKISAAGDFVIPPRTKAEIFTNLGIYIAFPDSAIARLAEEQSSTCILLGPKVVLGVDSRKELSFRIFNFSSEIVKISSGERFVELQLVRTGFFPPAPERIAQPSREVLEASMVTYSDVRRAATFDPNKWHGPNRYEMASAGFIQTSRYTVQCAFCNVRISGWTRYDSPLLRHVVARNENMTSCDFLDNYDDLVDGDSHFDWADELEDLKKMDFDDWCLMMIKSKTQDE